METALGVLEGSYDCLQGSPVQELLQGGVPVTLATTDSLRTRNSTDYVGEVREQEGKSWLQCSL